MRINNDEDGKMSQIIHSNGKTFEIIKRDERLKCAHTLEEAIEETSEYIGFCEANNGQIY